MNKTTPKKLHMGYELRINRTGESGAHNWTRVDGLFASTYEADEYRKRHYPNVTKYVIMGIKVSALPKVPERFQFAVDKPKEKKGTHSAPKQS